MRLLVYNIRYGTGAGAAFERPAPVGYLRSSTAHTEIISRFIASHEPDIVGLVEVDGGSLRAGRVNQAERIAEQLGHQTAYLCKYPRRSLNHLVPILRQQGNALLSAVEAQEVRHHWFDRGVKRLVIEVRLEQLSVFLVHLSLHFPHRQRQLRHLARLVEAADRPVLVTGDFNTLRGQHELAELRADCGLRSANLDGLPSFPSWAPKKELDFILYGEGIEVTGFEIPEVLHSDHLPLVCDFELAAATA